MAKLLDYAIEKLANNIPYKLLKRSLNSFFYKTVKIQHYLYQKENKGPGGKTKLLKI